MYESVAHVTQLLAKSEYHREISFASYLRNQIHPPLLLGQLAVYQTLDDFAIAFISWAKVSESIEKELCQGRRLQLSEWQCGDRVFINDFVAPYGGTTAIVSDVRSRFFRGCRTAKSVRRSKSGDVRKVCRWKLDR